MTNWSEETVNVSETELGLIKGGSGKPLLIFHDELGYPGWMAWNAALARFLRPRALLRLSIHPPDYSYPAIWRQIVDLISAMDGVRTPITYQDWIAEQRSMADRGA